MLLNLSGVSITTLTDDLVRDELSRLDSDYDDIKELNISNCDLGSLEGITLFKNLHTLIASHNRISVIDQIASLYGLRNVKLDHNCLTDIYIRTHANGRYVLSSFSDVSALSFEKFAHKDISVTEKVSDNILGGLDAEGYEYIDLSFNKIETIQGLVPGRLKCFTLILSNNLISVVDGLCSFLDIRVLDLSFNVECDIRKLSECSFAPNCKIFLQSIKLQNVELLEDLLNSHKNAVAYTDLGDVHHERLLQVCNLDLTKLREKRFISTSSGYADFVYDGDEFPDELLTPRCDTYTNSDKAYINRSLDILEPFETGSTADTSYFSKSFSYLEQNPKSEKGKQSSDEYNSVKYLPKTATPGVSHLDFLYSSIRLCNAIDSWSNDIKNTLLKNTD